MAAVEALFRYTSVTEQALRSFDDYTVNKIKRIIDTEIRVKSQLEEDNLEHVVRIHSTAYGEPCVVERDNETRVLTSTEAKLRDLTYSVPLYAQVDYTLRDTANGGCVKSHKTYKNVFIARIPLMVRSSLDSTQNDPRNNECEEDPGGYFIINGREKTVVIQENIKPNTIMVFSSKSKGIESIIYPQLDSLTMTNATVKAYKRRDCIFVDFNGQFPKQRPVIVKKAPLKYLVYVLGETYESLEEYVTYGVEDFTKRQKLINYIEPSFDEPITYKGFGLTPNTIAGKCREDAAAFVIQRSWLRYVNHNVVLCSRLNLLSFHREYDKMMYPHDKENGNQILLEQIKMLAYTELGMREPDSRDAEKNKRVASAGTLMTSLTATLWNMFIVQLTKTVQKYVNSRKQLRMNKLCKTVYITDQLKYALATGNWRAKDQTGGKTGVSQALNRQTYISCISQLRRIDSSVPSDSKIVDPRMLRGDVWGMRCPSETVEGGPCGLVSQLSVAARISVESDTGNIYKLLRRFKKKGKYPVYVNGCYYGSVANMKKVAKSLRYHRRVRTLPIDISVSTVDGKLLVFCDAGRIVRPVFVVRGLDEVGTTEEMDMELRSGRMTWDDLLSGGVIEYIDSQETECCLIALDESEVTPHHTHCEIHCSLILGVMANTIPYPEHNQSPRITYQSAMGKQALGMYALNFESRFDTMGHIMNYPQKPLVTTRIQDLVAGNMPAGHNAIVAILIYGGYNQEDSVLINQASLDRGFGRITMYRTYSASDVARGQKRHVFGKENPDNTCIEDDGLPIPNTPVKKNDVIIGRKVGSRDASVLNKKNPGIIHDVIVSQNDQGGQTVKVKVRQTRIPQVGDKFCYSEDHELLTIDGWKPVADVYLGEKVAIFDHGKLVYEPTLDIHKYKIENEEMYEVQTQQFSLKTTLNHKMYVKKRNASKYELIQAKDMMGKRVRFLKNCEGLMEFEVPLCPVPITDYNAWLFFFGFWIGYGWTEDCRTTTKTRKKHTYRTTICQVKIPSRRRILDAAIKCGLRPVENGDKIHFYFKPLTDFLCPLSKGAPNKHLPEWCFKLSKEHSVYLLKGLIDSDGSVNKSGSWAYYTSSYQLKDDVQRLALHAGLSANVSIRHKAGHVTEIKGRTITSKYDSWQVRINRRKNSPQLNHGHSRTQSGQTEHIVKETGYVYCVSVRTGVVYVRRHGKTVWCGNSSRHGQKGTVGLIVPETDMPYTIDGIRPDIVISPHALPSRMTVAHVIECLASKIAALSGNRKFATAFDHEDVYSYTEQLHSLGYQKTGDECMFDGRTGKKLEGLVFLGPTYYQRLKHMVEDKIHSRNNKGKVVSMTRQPAEGRARGGGLRFGEMERDVGLSYGAANVLHDRMLKSSDAYETPTCEKCGLVGTHIYNQRKDKCCHCGGNIQYVEMPFASKQLLQEMMSMGIAPRLKLKS